MKIRIQNIIILIALFIFSCEKDNPTSTVGESLLVVAELPEENQDLEFIWEFIDLPDNSILENVNLRIGDDNSSIVFTPDAPGTYSLSVSIFQYNDEISTQTFAYDVISDGSENISFSQESENNLIIENPDTIKTDSTIIEINNDKWYDSDIASQIVEDLNTVEKSLDTTATTSKKLQKPKQSKTALPISKKKKIKKQSKGMSIPFDKNRFTIQVASKKRIDDAKKIAARLIDAGYDAYIQKAYFKENNETWYRIRVGSYNDKEKAQKMATSLSNDQKEKAWVDHVRVEN